MVVSSSRAKVRDTPLATQGGKALPLPGPHFDLPLLVGVW